MDLHYSYCPAVNTGGSIHGMDRLLVQWLVLGQLGMMYMGSLGKAWGAFRSGISWLRLWKSRQQDLRKRTRFQYNLEVHLTYLMLWLDEEYPTIALPPQ